MQMTSRVTPKDDAETRWQKAQQKAGLFIVFRSAGDRLLDLLSTRG